jgi:hypothetical protein
MLTPITFEKPSCIADSNRLAFTPSSAWAARWDYKTYGEDGCNGPALEELGMVGGQGFEPRTPSV